jgi:hypothetical protein
LPTASPMRAICGASEEYPEILFCHATGQTAALRSPNVCNYFTRVYESR